MPDWDMARALAEGADPKTRDKTIEYLWAPLLRFYGVDRDPSTITYDDLEAYVGARRKAGVKGQTIRREQQALKRALVIAKRRRLIARVPAEWPRIKSDPPDQAQSGKLHPAEIMRAYVEALKKKPTVLEHVEIHILTGLRKEEQRRLRLTWVVDAPEGAATPFLLRVPAPDAKTDRARVLGLCQRARDIILTRAARMGKDGKPHEGPLFAADHKKALRACVPEKYPLNITLRDLRHWYGTEVLRGTGDPWAALSALGHTDLRTTSRYQHTDEERAAATGAAAEAAWMRLLSSGGGTVEGGQELAASKAARAEALDSTKEKDGGQSGDRTHGTRLVRRCPHCNHAIWLDTWEPVEHEESRTYTTQGGQPGVTVSELPKRRRNGGA